MSLSGKSFYPLLCSLFLAIHALGAEHNFARWENEIAAFEQQEKNHPTTTGGFLFTGSSTIRMWKTLPKVFPFTNVINHGFGGSQIIDAEHFANRLIFPLKPSVVFLRAGGNDLWEGKSVDQVYEDFQKFVKTVHEGLPQTTIVFISLSPSIARWKQADKEKAVNGLVQEYTRKNKGVKFIDTWTVPLDAGGQPRPELFLPDKLHFNEAGYELLNQRVRMSWRDLGEINK
jgi:lysophospholipase L1-like esterase